jgi:protein-S-isoprenylcysteine O-methyltransferase Ste14
LGANDEGEGEGGGESKSFRLSGKVNRLEVSWLEAEIERPGGDMSDANSDAPGVRIIPPLVYLAGIIVGLLTSFLMPTKLIPDSVAWAVGGILILCGAALAGSAISSFKGVGTTIRPDRAASTLVVAGPYKFTRNPMYLGLAVVYLGITIADQSLWALILLPVVLTIIQRRAIEPEEAFLERRFGAIYISYKATVRRWL